MGVADRVGPRWDEARARAAELAPKMVEHLRRMGPVFAKLAATCRVLGILGAAAAGFVVIVVAILVKPSSGAVWLVVAALAVVLEVAPLMVLWCGRSLRELSTLPDFISRSPDLVARNGEAFAKLYLDTAGQWGEPGKVRLLGGGLFRAAKLVRSLLEDIPELESVLTLGNPAFLAAAAVAAVATFVEILFTPVAALVLLLGLVMG